MARGWPSEPQGPCVITPAVPAGGLLHSPAGGRGGPEAGVIKAEKHVHNFMMDIQCSQRGERASSTQNTPSEPGVQVPSPSSQSPRAPSPDPVPPTPR